MATRFTLILLLSILLSSPLVSSSQSCSDYTFSNNQVFSSCTDLPHLGASLHWTSNPSSNTVGIAFKAPQASSGWVAWGINPTSAKMVGTQALVAFLADNGTTVSFPTQLSSYSPSMSPMELSFPVSDLSAEYSKKKMVIFATLGLSGNGTELNHVWQVGSSVVNGVPQAHSPSGENIQTMGTIAFQ